MNLKILAAMKRSDDFEKQSVESILLWYQARACNLWQVEHGEEANPSEGELHELAETLLARRIFELQNGRRRSNG